MLLVASTALADDSGWDLAGHIELQSRVFAEEAAWPGQGARAQAALAATAELRWQNVDRSGRVSVVPFLRWDARDSARSRVDLPEAYWAWRSESLEWLVGANTVFWGVTESVHLVDIINQTDTAGDIDGEDKLGQPMINVAWQREWGLLSAYVLPVFRERTFPGIDGRLRAPLAVDDDHPVYESGEGRQHIDLALRYSHYIGDVDIGLSLFRGTGREPRLVPAPGAAALVPHYDRITQLGVDLQYTRDAWLWKLETILRDGYAQRFAAMVGGFEYTAYQLRGSPADLGVLVEYQYDGRNAAEPLTTSDNDIFVGTRLALNDVQDTSLLAGLARDLDTGETFFNIEAERRFGDDIIVELRARAFSGARPGDASFAVARDDYVEVRIAKYY